LADRVRDGETGFLVDNDAAAVVATLRGLDRDRAVLGRARRALEARRPRTESDMHSDYANLLGLPRVSAAALDSTASLPLSAYRRVTADGSAVVVDDQSALPPGRHGRDTATWPASATARAPRRLAPDAYTRLIAQIRRCVDENVPSEAVVAVVSRGDQQLLHLGGRRARHFPEAPGGGYLGHHPADSADAVAYLESAVARGVDHLVVPATAAWWLQHYRGFRQHLEANSRRVHEDESCVIYGLVAGEDQAELSPATMQGAASG
jgi:hypothetical protein